MNLAAAAESPTRVGANLAVAGVNLAVAGANLAVAGVNLAVAGVNLGVVGVNLAVVGVNLAGVGVNLAGVGVSVAVAGVNLGVVGVNLTVAGVNLAVVGVNLAAVGVSLAVAGVNLAGVGVSLAVAGVNLAVAGVNLAVVGVNLTRVRLSQAGAGMEPTTACLCLETSSKPAPTTSTSLEIVADLGRVSCLLPEMATDPVDVGRLPCLPTKLFAGSAGILPAFFFVWPAAPATRGRNPWLAKNRPSGTTPPAPPVSSVRPGRFRAAGGRWRRRCRRRGVGGVEVEEDWIRREKGLPLARGARMGPQEGRAEPSQARGIFP